MNMQTCRDRHEQPGPPHPHLHAAEDEDLSPKRHSITDMCFDNLATSASPDFSCSSFSTSPMIPAPPKHPRLGAQISLHRGRQVNQLQIKGPGQASPRWASPSLRCLPRSRFTRTGPVPVATYHSRAVLYILPCLSHCPIHVLHRTRRPKTLDQRYPAYLPVLDLTRR